jgi:hypothetical protein
MRPRRPRTTGSGGNGRFSDDEPAGLTEDAVRRTLVECGEQVRDRGGAEMLEAEVHGGQRRVAVGGELRPVVVADDGDVLGYAASEVA